MRIGLLCTLLLGWALLGVDCLPLVQGPGDEPEPAISAGASVLSPIEDVTVAQGHRCGHSLDCVRSVWGDGDGVDVRRVARGPDADRARRQCRV